MVGPVDHYPNAYRVFEHSDWLVQALWEMVSDVFMFGVPVFLISQTPLMRLEAWGRLTSDLIVPKASGHAANSYFHTCGPMFT